MFVSPMRSATSEPVAATFHLALPFVETQEERVEQAGAFCFGQKLAAKTDQPARRNFVLQPHAARAVVDHLGHLAFASARGFGDDADEFLGHVDDDQFDRLKRLAGLFVLFRDDLRF